MGRTACTEPQCLYKGDLYLYTLFKGEGGKWSFTQFFYNFFFAKLGENSVDEIHAKFSSAFLSNVKIGVVKFTSCSFTLPNLTFTLPYLT